MALSPWAAASPAALPARQQLRRPWMWWRCRWRSAATAFLQRRRRTRRMSGTGSCAASTACWWGEGGRRAPGTAAAPGGDGTCWALSDRCVDGSVSPTNSKTCEGCEVRALAEADARRTRVLPPLRRARVAPPAQPCTHAQGACGAPTRLCNLPTFIRSPSPALPRSLCLPPRAWLRAPCPCAGQHALQWRLVASGACASACKLRSRRRWVSARPQFAPALPAAGSIAQPHRGAIWATLLGPDPSSTPRSAARRRRRLSTTFERRRSICRAEESEDEGGISEYCSIGPDGK